MQRRMRPAQLLIDDDIVQPSNGVSQRPAISLQAFVRDPAQHDFRGKIVNIVSGDHSYLGRAYHASLLIEAQGGVGTPSVDELFYATRKSEISNMIGSLANKRYSQRACQDSDRFRLGVLCDPADPMPPTWPDGLDVLTSVGKTLATDVTILSPSGIDCLHELNGLFIRTTDAFDFAFAAVELGIPVLGNPRSMLRCNNKAFVVEILRRNQVPVPQTAFITDSDEVLHLHEKIEYPMVIKLPHMSGGRGVFLAVDRGALIQYVSHLSRSSAVLIAQQFVPTAFDWRVGVLDDEVLFVCRYYMVDQNWKVVAHTEGGDIKTGRIEPVPACQWPQGVVSAAVNAARLFGSGLYGIDVKDFNGDLFVTDVNDCPDINHEEEDCEAGHSLWEKLIKWFMKHQLRSEY
jgi:glutathione synthase/RimK-type ligase-like ATP-grasp enzyme